MATNQNEEFVQLLCYSTNIYKNVMSKYMYCTCSEIAIKTYMYFQFSHYKSMETFKLPQQRKHMSNGNEKHKFCRG